MLTPTHNMRTCIVAVAQLRLEADGSVGTAPLREAGLRAVVCAGIVPCQADDDGVTCVERERR